MRTKAINLNKRDCRWHIIDADKAILGRVSSKIANCLLGKEKVEYTPNMDNGDYVIVINARKILISGKKRNDKIYYSHTGYIGHLKKVNFAMVQKKDPCSIIRRAVRGMLPKNAKGYKLLDKKLKIYPDENHMHESQNPKLREFE